MEKEKREISELKKKCQEFEDENEYTAIQDLEDELMMENLKLSSLEDEHKILIQQSNELKGLNKDITIEKEKINELQIKLNDEKNQKELIIVQMKMYSNQINFQGIKTLLTQIIIQIEHQDWKMI